MTLALHSAEILLADLVKSGDLSIKTLFELASQVDAKVKNSLPGDTFLLYSGILPDGRRTSEFSAELASRHPGVHDIGSTAMARFIEGEKFRDALEFAVALDKFSAPPRALSVAQLAELGGATKLLHFGIDAEGRHVSSTSLFDIASHAYVEANDGNWRIIAGADVDPHSILVQTELPALLEKSGDFTIDGLSRSALAGSGSVADQIEHVVANATLISYASEPSASNIERFLDLRPHTALEFLGAAEQAGLRNAAKEALGKLGWAGDLIALGLVASEANAAIAEGDNERAASILGRWAAEFAGGLATGLAAAQLVGSALAPLYLAGPAGALAAGALTLLAGVAGGIFGGEAAGAAFDEFVKQLSQQFSAALHPIDPLVLDLNGDGVSTLARNKGGVYFDLDNNGFAENTGWVSPSDGFLALDINGNGRIDSGAELFGNHMLLPNGNKAAHGFAALMAMDTDGDGKITSADQVFSQLRIWQDANSNGISDAGELRTLQEYGITALNLRFVSPGGPVDAQGNDHRQKGTFETSDGRIHSMDDVWLSADTVRSRGPEEVALSTGIAALPDVQGMGVLRSLHQAMATDSSGNLQKLVEQWIATPSARPRLIEEILQVWAGASDVAAGTRGPWVDAKKLVVVEAFVGQGFLQALNGNGGTTASPGSAAAGRLNEAYALIVQYVGDELIRQSDVVALLNSVQFEFDVSVGHPTLAVDGTVALLRTGWDADNSPDRSITRDRLMKIFSWLGKGGPSAQVVAEALAEAGAALGDEFGATLSQQGRYLHYGSDGVDWWSSSSGRWTTVFAGNGDDQITTSGGNDRLFGGAGADRLWAGNGDDFLSGDEGDDHLFGGVGNDTLHGGTGNDRLEGGYGDDTYHFNLGDGRDTIVEAGTDVDVLKLGPGLSPDDTIVLRKGDDLYLHWGGEDSVTSQGQFYFYGAKGSGLERIEFSDGTVWTFPDIVSRLVQDGTDGNDTILGVRDAVNRIQGLGGNDFITGHTLNDVLDGGAGDDRLQGGAGHDELYGGAGDDRLEGGDGDDTLHGGTGNDRLEGWYGDDTYHFNLGDGRDTIVEAGTGVDVLKLGPGLSPDDTVVLRKGDDLYLHWGGEDSVTSQGQFYFYGAKGSGLERIEFADGTVWTFLDIVSRLVQDGTDGNDTILGVRDAVNRIQGLGGNDFITGHTLNDVLDGGAGDDRLQGGAGHDELYGGAGDDRLEGGDGDDTLHGGTGNDRLEGWYGDDTLHGGTGNDRLEGGYGNDTYVFELGDGSDTIVETSGDRGDVLLFKGIDLSRLWLNREGSNLSIQILGSSDSVNVEGWFSGSKCRIEEFRTEDGKAFNATEIASLIEVMSTQLPPASWQPI